MQQVSDRERRCDKTRVTDKIVVKIGWGVAKLKLKPDRDHHTDVQIQFIAVPENSLKYNVALSEIRFSLLTLH